MAVVIPTSYAQEYKPIEITNIRPVDILPIIWQIEAGDKKVYKHIEHLRIAETTRIRDMMRKYGAGSHSAEEYQQLMNRLNTGMTLESPKWYNNYEIIWWNIEEEPSNHAHNEWNILNTIIDHANFKVLNPSHWSRNVLMKNEVDNNPQNIYIFWNSNAGETNKDEYLSRDINTTKDLCRYPNFLLFSAWWNIYEKDWILKNKLYHEDVDGDNHWVYRLGSETNWKANKDPNIHLIVTIWTNDKWDIDQTDEIFSSSKYPVWFHDNVVFAWRAFPYLNWATWEICGENWKYVTSYTNYVNVAMADLCFQLFAEVDIDRLLEMMRFTSLTDHIRFNWEDQPLKLINPAGFFLKYLMPTDLPTTISWSQTADLSKSYYHGLAFDIPGAEVKINGEWISFSAENKDLVFAQNPFALEWRLNGDLLRKFGYKQDDTVKGRIIAIDDHWNGLNLSQDISITVSKENTGIREFETSSSTTSRSFAPNGQRVGKGYKGIVISNGRKTITK